MSQVEPRNTRPLKLFRIVFCCLSAHGKPLVNCWWLSAPKAGNSEIFIRFRRGPSQAMPSTANPAIPLPHHAVYKTSSIFFDWWQWFLSFFWTATTKTDQMAGVKTWTVTEPYLNIHCGLGEGPYYERDTNTLRFVDIKKKKLHTVDLSKGPESLKTLQFDMPVGVTADIEGVDPSKKILIGGKSGIYVLDRVAEKWVLLKKFYDTEEKDERLRSNDGAIDPQGRFWVGTMNDFWVGEPQAEGEWSLSFAAKNTGDINSDVPTLGFHMSQLEAYHLDTDEAL